MEREREIFLRKITQLKQFLDPKCSKFLSCTRDENKTTKKPRQESNYGQKIIINNMYNMHFICLGD